MVVVAKPLDRQICKRIETPRNELLMKLAELHIPNHQHLRYSLPTPFQRVMQLEIPKEETDANAQISCCYARW